MALRFGIRTDLLSTAAVVLTLMTSSHHLFARPTVSIGSPRLKIALIAFEQVVVATNEGQRVVSDVQKEFEPKKKEIDAVGNELESLKRELDVPQQAQGTRAELLRTYTEKLAYLNSEVEKATLAYNETLQKNLGEVAVRLTPCMTTYVYRNGYTVLLDVGGTSSPVLWANQTTDVSQAVVNAYNHGTCSTALQQPGAMTAQVAVIDFEKSAVDSEEGQNIVHEIQAKYSSMGASVNTEAYKEELQAALGKMEEKFSKSMRDYVSQHGFTLLIDKKPLTALWAAPGIDISQVTKEGMGVDAPVMQAFNAISFPTPSAPAPMVATSPFRGLRPEQASSPTRNSRPSVPIPHNYALIFATSSYLHWRNLSNPVPDADAVNRTLTSLYGFTVEEVRNPTADQILRKLNEYLGKNFEVQDQLLIFFAGHGYFDERLGQGFLVPHEAETVAEDVGHRTLLPHDTLMHYVNRIKAQHIVLVVDACFAGTLDRRVADSGLRGDSSSDVYAHVSLPELLQRKEEKRTRRYFASGGREYVPDGIPGHHSPFVAAFLTALNQAADRKGYATLDDLQIGLNTVKPEPRWGEIMGDNEPGADFLLLTPEAISQLSKSQ